MAETPPVVPGSYGETRRHPRAAGDVTHAVAVPEPAAGEAGHEAPGAPGALRPAREGGSVVAGAELARAFQANADALQNLGAMQAEMMQALGRNDRSEMILASTQTLNETFRHLTLIQRELLGRLERGVEDGKRSSRAVPLLLLGLMAVVVLGTYVLVEVAQKAIDKNDPRAITEHAVALLQAERNEAEKESEADAKRVRVDLEEQETRRRALEAQLDREREEHAQAQRDLTVKETELSGLRHQFGTAQGEALKVPSLESEIRDLSAKVTIGEPRLRSLQEQLDEARRENNRLRKKMAGDRMGFPEDDPGSEPGPAVNPGAAETPPTTFPPPTPEVGAENPAHAPATPAPGTPSPAAPPPATPPPVPITARDTEGSRDPRVLDDVRSRLNKMFDAAGSKRPDYWQVMRVDAVTQDRLKGVIVNRYDADARLVESVEAREAFVWVERDKRRVMLELRQGERVSGGQRTPLPDGKFQTVLAEGEALTQVFAASGLRLIGSR